MNDTGRSVALEKNRDAVRVALDDMSKLVRECEKRCALLEQALGAANARVTALEGGLAVLRATTAGRGPTVRG